MWLDTELSSLYTKYSFVQFNYVKKKKKKKNDSKLFLL